MEIKGIKRTFSLIGEEQYNTISAFWDEMESLYGLENLLGVGYNWQEGSMDYLIALSDGVIDGFNETLILPDDGWISRKGRTESLKALYDEIYKDGRLSYEIERFYENGECLISFIRA